MADFFKQTYQILETLDEQGIIDKDGDFELYEELLDEVFPVNKIKKDYVPHNIHYKDEDNCLPNVESDDGNIPSSEEILKKLDESSDDE